jgi:hypothetical protein
MYQTLTARCLLYVYGVGLTKRVEHVYHRPMIYMICNRSDSTTSVPPGLVPCKTHILTSFSKLHTTAYERAV